MEDLRVRRTVRDGLAEVLPETLEEAERLVASIERAVQRETDCGVADLTVEVGPRRHSTHGPLRDLLHQATGPARRHAGPR